MRRPAIVLCFLALAPVVSSAAAAAQQKKAHKAPPKAVQTAPDPAPAPAPPPAPPPTPEQGPSLPPEVSYAGGQLTIVARNSTMADVLNGVKQKTGAAVDMPVASSERVVGRFGPGAPRDVLAQLLNGSHYDYVLLGSPSDPGALKKIVLMARASGPEVAAQPAQNAAAQGAPGVSVPDGQANQGAMEDNSEEIQPDMQQQVPDEEPQAEQPEPGQNQPVIKTPEQLLRELQQQQQQQQQMQQQIQQQDQQNTNPPTMVPRRYPQQ